VEVGRGQYRGGGSQMVEEEGKKRGWRVRKQGKKGKEVLVPQGRLVAPVSSGSG
jgi:hypothetical protein